jgi:hypothetical protein
MNEYIYITGSVEIYVNAALTETHNLVVNTGKEWIAKCMKGVYTPITHIAVGSDGTAETVIQTTLVSEGFRKALTISGGTQSGMQIQFEGSLLAGEGTGTINEAGLFDAAAAGVMLSRAVIGPYVKNSNDVITFVWTITVN